MAVLDRSQIQVRILRSIQNLIGSHWSSRKLFHRHSQKFEISQLVVSLGNIIRTWKTYSEFAIVLVWVKWAYRATGDIYHIKNKAKEHIKEHEDSKICLTESTVSHTFGKDFGLLQKWTSSLQWTRNACELNKGRLINLSRIQWTSKGRPWRSRGSNWMAFN